MMNDLPLSQLVIMDSRLTDKYGEHYHDCIYRANRDLVQEIRKLEQRIQALQDTK